MSARHAKRAARDGVGRLAHARRAPYGGPNLARYSEEMMNDLTISDEM